MIILFTQHWDLIPGKEEDYTRFAINQHIPTLKKIGIHMVGGYHVIVGSGPRIIAVGVVDDFQKLQKALISEEFEKITHQLKEFVCNYYSKILKPTGRVKTEKYSIQLRVWKFNQYFNVLPGKEKEYGEFILNDHLPTMEKLGIKMTGGWRVMVGCGPSRIAEGTTHSLLEIAKAIDSDEFKRVTHVLISKFVTDYSSRILAPTGRIELPFLLGQMMKGF